MKLEFKDIIDKHKNKPALVQGHGPSLNDYLVKRQELKDNGFILFDCNDWWYFDQPLVIPNYWMLSRPEPSVRQIISKINQYKVTLFYADSADLTDRNWVEQNFQCDYLPYDNRHFNGKTNIHACGMPYGFDYSCCDAIIPGRLTIQEELQKYTGYSEHYSGGDTSILFNISFAILMGCNPIYIIGMDLDYSIGYAKAKYTTSEMLKGGNATVEVFKRAVHRVLKDLDTINNSAKNINVKIFNLNKKAWFNNIEIGDIS